MNISTDLLHTYIAVCEHGNFSHAAAKLGMAQSSVSEQIAAMERQVGLNFFDRRKRPIKLTQAGTLFLDFAKAVTNRAQSTERLLHEMADRWQTA
jgi:LysR family cyn operon transcriptional activator